MPSENGAHCEKWSKAMNKKTRRKTYYTPFEPRQYWGDTGRKKAVANKRDAVATKRARAKSRKARQRKGAAPKKDKPPSKGSSSSAARGKSPAKRSSSSAAAAGGSSSSAAAAAPVARSGPSAASNEVGRRSGQALWDRINAPGASSWAEDTGPVGGAGVPRPLSLSQLTGGGRATGKRKRAPAKKPSPAKKPRSASKAPTAAASRPQRKKTQARPRSSSNNILSRRTPKSMFDR